MVSDQRPWWKFSRCRGVLVLCSCGLQMGQDFVHSICLRRLHTPPPPPPLFKFYGGLNVSQDFRCLSSRSASLCLRNCRAGAAFNLGCPLCAFRWNCFITAVGTRHRRRSGRTFLVVTAPKLAIAPMLAPATARSHRAAWLAVVLSGCRGKCRPLLAHCDCCGGSTGPSPCSSSSSGSLVITTGPLDRR